MLEQAELDIIEKQIADRIKKVGEWCDAKWGRQTIVARALDIPRSRISMVLSGERELTLREWLMIEAVMIRDARAFRKRNIATPHAGSGQLTPEAVEPDLESDLVTETHPQN